jgi:hypothetical protein
MKNQETVLFNHLIHKEESKNLQHFFRNVGMYVPNYASSQPTTL